MQKVLIQPRFIRVFHWLTAFGLIALLLTGLYIHNPVFSAPYLTMNTALLVQLGLGFLTAGLVTVRLYYSLKTGDYNNILFRYSDIPQFIGLMKYYFFLEKKEPPHEKYNAGQKLIFSSWLLVFTFQLITGILLYYPHLTMDYPFFGHLQSLRFYHYLGALWFLGTLPVHVYLVTTGDPGRLQAIFTGWARISKPQKAK